MNEQDDIFENLSQICRTEQRYMLSAITSFAIGGTAKLAVFPNSAAELQNAMTVIWKANLPYLIIGRGTNLLVSDDGFDGIAAIIDGGIDNVFQIDGKRWHFGAGAALSNAISIAAKSGYSGLEEISGVPGSIGGAAKMNASAYEKSFYDKVVSLKILTRKGIEEIGVDKIAAKYRGAKVPDDTVILSATMMLDEKSPDSIFKEIKKFNSSRAATQPLGERSAGCIFKNPEGHYAGMLIENAGLKGKAIGGAVVSKKHANFIINKNNATAQDIVELIRYTREKVFEQFNIELELEVIPVGFREKI